MPDIHIPPAALEAGKDTAFAWLRSHMEDDVRVQNMTDEELGELVEAAIRAMLAAWPGAAICHYTIADNEGYEMVLPLPFPQENPDAEA